MSAPVYSGMSSSSTINSNTTSSSSNQRQNTRTRQVPALLDDPPFPPINNSTESLELIDIDEGIDSPDLALRGRVGNIQAESIRHRRHMSLSPLRTFAAMKHRRHVESMHSQPGSPSSSSSLASSSASVKSVTPLVLSPSSSKKPGRPRRLFGLGKGKGREILAEEDLEWEVVDRASSSESPTTAPSPRPESVGSFSYQGSTAPSSINEEDVPEQSRPSSRISQQDSIAPRSQHEEYSPEKRTLSRRSSVIRTSQQDVTNSSSSHTESIVAQPIPRPQRSPPPPRLGISPLENYPRTGSPLSAVSWVSATDFEPPSPSYCTAISERSISESTVRDSEYGSEATMRDSSEYGSILGSNISISSAGTGHYHGRPLPRTPAPSTYRSMYDSIYGGPSPESRPESPCAEGLLIDLAEPIEDRSYSEDTLRAFTGVGIGSRASVASTDTVSSTGTFNTAAGTLDRYSQASDLDSLASSISEESGRRGSDYEVRSFVLQNMPGSSWILNRVYSCCKISWVLQPRPH
jgi:hypothetical protein